MGGVVCVLVLLICLWMDHQRKVQIQKARGEYVSFFELLREPWFVAILLAVVVWFVAWYFANNGDGVPQIIGAVISYPPLVLICILFFAAVIKVLIDPPENPKDAEWRRKEEESASQSPNPPNGGLEHLRKRKEALLREQEEIRQRFRTGSLYRSGQKEAQAKEAESSAPAKNPEDSENIR